MDSSSVNTRAVIDSLVLERDQHGDEKCARSAFLIIIGTARRDRRTTKKLYRDCIGHREISLAMNFGVDAYEIKNIWESAPFRTIDDALRISLSSANVYPNGISSLKIGLSMALSFNPHVAYAKKAPYLFKLASSYFRDRSYFPESLEGELYSEVLHMCMAHDKKDVSEYLSLLISLGDQGRLKKAISQAALPYFRKMPLNENLFILFNGSTFGLQLLEQAVHSSESIPDIERIISHVEGFLVSEAKIENAIRVTAIICSKFTQINELTPLRAARIAAKTIGYGAHGDLYESVIEAISSIASGSSLILDIHDECRLNVLKLESLKQSAYALVQLEKSIEPSEFDVLKQKLCSSIASSASVEALDALSIISCKLASQEDISIFIACFLQLSRKFGLGLMDASQFLKPLLEGKAYEFKHLVELLVNQSFDRPLLRIAITWCSVYHSQQAECFGLLTSLGHKWLGTNPNNRQNFEATKLVKPGKHNLDWPLNQILLGSPLVRPRTSDQDDSEMNEDTLFLFLPEYSIESIVDCKSDLASSSDSWIAEWYIRHYPHLVARRLSNLSKYSSVTKLFLEQAWTNISSVEDCQELANALDFLINSYVKDIEECLSFADPQCLSHDALVYYQSLTLQDIQLVRRWNDNSYLNPGQASRLLAARVAEKYVIRLLGRFYGSNNVRDVSLEQLKAVGGESAWQLYDVYVEVGQKGIDCKNARQPLNSSFFSEYQVPEFKKNRASSKEIEYACCLSEYIRSANFDVTSDSALLSSCHSLRESSSITLMGVVTSSILGSMKVALRRHNIPLEIIPDRDASSSQSYFIPEWMLGSCDWIQQSEIDCNLNQSLASSTEMLMLCLKAFKGVTDQTQGMPNANGPGCALVRYKAEFLVYCISLMVAPTLRADAFRRETGDNTYHSFELLVALLQAATSCRAKSALFLWWVSELISCLSGRIAYSDSGFSVLSTTSVHAVCNLIGDSTGYMKMAWDTLACLAERSLSDFDSLGLVSFRLHTKGLLTAKSATGQRITLIAYCGGRVSLGGKGAVSCGNNPLYAGMHKWCQECNRLICDKCDFCSHGCRRINPDQSSICRM